MKPMFSRGSSLQLRFALSVVIAIVLIIIDSRYLPFAKIRSYLDTAISPVYHFLTVPRHFLDDVSENFTSRHVLQQENQTLRQQLFLKDTQLLRLDHFEQENARLRELLGSPLLSSEHRMVAQVLSIGTDPYSDQLIINKGSHNGVYVGQPVISDRGVVGQVVARSNNTSRVLLICNPAHAIPVQVLRNGLRAIAAGNGCGEPLQLEELPSHVDILSGDVLVTSGLGGKFPEGYPVAVVSSVQIDTQRAQTIVKAKPTSSLQHLRYLLLLWNEAGKESSPQSPEAVKKIANERLTHMLPQALSVQPTQEVSSESSSPIVLKKEGKSADSRLLQGRE